MAKRAGVNLQTIRYYQQRGLLADPPRSASGYRCFTDDAVRRIRFIKRGQQLGFSLDELRDLLALRVQPGATCAQVRQRAEAKAADVEERIRALRAMQKALKRLAGACTGRGPVSECPILESLDARDVF
ncbi:MAG: heavy metal-responsive transcriptional regulator [Acidobacteria bacterium]|nr:heavy metal-responsive transcriptional regulator [Acidobacteriota bacterium]